MYNRFSLDRLDPPASLVPPTQEEQVVSACNAWYQGEVRLLASQRHLAPAVSALDASHVHVEISKARKGGVTAVQFSTDYGQFEDRMKRPARPIRNTTVWF